MDLDKVVNSLFVYNMQYTFFLLSLRFRSTLNLPLASLYGERTIQDHKVVDSLFVYFSHVF